jgi:hypothetical protein
MDKKRTERRQNNIRKRDNFTLKIRKHSQREKDKNVRRLKMRHKGEGTMIKKLGTFLLMNKEILKESAAKSYIRRAS